MMYPISNRTALVMAVIATVMMTYTQASINTDVLKTLEKEGKAQVIVEFKGSNKQALRDVDNVIDSINARSDRISLIKDSLVKISSKAQAGVKTLLSETNGRVSLEVE